MKAVSPFEAIISVGAGNTYKHPSDSILQLLKNYGVNTYRTDLQGDIVVVSSYLGYYIEKLPILINSIPTVITPPTITPPTSSNDVSTSTRVNINTASFEELKGIIHISDARATEIIQKRPFLSVNALTIINGIGPARLADIIEEGKAYVE